MNEYGQDDFATSLSPWINEYLNETKSTQVSDGKPFNLTIEQKQKGMAEVYRLCQDEVLRRLADTPDNLGRSQMWKVNAIKEDIKNKKTDTSAMTWLAKEVAAMVEKYF
jgi:hypothetical protein